MDKESGHKRSKASVSSSKPLAFLHKTASNEPPLIALTAHKSRDIPITMPRLSSERSRDSTLPRLSLERSRENNTPAASTPAPLVSSMSPTGTAGGQPASIEASVKVFRVYEALRSGNPAVVTNIIRDTTSVGESALQGTTILHIAIQCADDAIVEQVLATSPTNANARESKDGNTALHLAAAMNRPSIVHLLLQQKDVDDSVANYHGKTALDLAKSPEVYEQLQMARSLYTDGQIKKCQRLVAAKNYSALEDMLVDDHFKSAVDINDSQIASDPSVVASGGTLLHQAAIQRDTKLVEMLLLNGADPFKRDRKGKLPQDVTEDKTTRALLKKSPAAAAAQRGIQEKTILGGGGAGLTRPMTGENALGGKEGREMKGYLKKWVNYTTGYKLRWFVLEDGVLSYYKHQDDAGSACRGAVNMKIAVLHMDGADNSRFEIIGKSSVKYHLKANHEVEAKRWFWALTNAIQYAKDEAKASARAQTQQADHLRQAQVGQSQGRRSMSPVKADRSQISAMATGSARPSMDIPDRSAFGGSLSADDYHHSAGTTAVGGDLDEDDDGYDDDASSIEAVPVTKDAFMIAAHSARLQLDLLTQISSALQSEKQRNPSMPISEPTVSQAFSSYESAVTNLRSLIGDLGRIAKDRESYWQYRFEQEVNMRRLWEDNMMKVAQDHEQLENQFAESEERRKRTKRALRDALENQTGAEPEEAVMSPSVEPSAPPFLVPRQRTVSIRRKSTFQEMHDIAGLESEDEDDEEFFDAVTAGEVEVAEEMPSQNIAPPPPAAAVALAHAPEPVAPIVHQAPEVSRAPQEVAHISHVDGLKAAFVGYEEPPRTKLKMDVDDRPKISLWGILKTMIGKDMSKMTLPVTFNEPTSLLQRVAEDMEYVDLLETAASRADSTERMVYVAAFAASEYASTIGRVAKPFNPLLGETYEYARPDKGFRFLIEQVSHHPPIGAAWAGAKSWDYWGESAVKSKFYGKSFEINPLGTWFLRLRPSSGGPPELYTWKKVTSSVVGIITGNPTIDNYGPMEVRNHTTGDICILDFKQRGWKASSAYGVSGKVLADGKPRWSMGGKWNEKIYARLTPGYVDELEASGKQAKDANPNKAFLVWECHARPTSGIPFNLTPFGITLNALTPGLKRVLPPTDTRLRPDQRCMEEGQYDQAAVEKDRLEEKQRAKRREREREGVVVGPRWFEKSVDKVTGEDMWRIKRVGGAGEEGEVEYWARRNQGDWRDCEDIF